MRRRVLWFLLVWEPLAEACWAWLRYLDNRRKGKPLSNQWQARWMRFVYNSQGYGFAKIHGDPYGVFEMDWTGVTPEWEKRR